MLGVPPMELRVGALIIDLAGPVADMEGNVDDGVVLGSGRLMRIPRVGVRFGVSASKPTCLLRWFWTKPSIL